MEPRQHNQPDSLCAATPARISAARAGTRPATQDWLTFRRDHALARDAVRSELSDKFIDEYAIKRGLPIVKSNAADRRDYILFPPKGKLVDEHTVCSLTSMCLSDRDVQIVISDGLSACAVEENAPDLLAILHDGLELEGITFGTPVVARLARVAIADKIAHALAARLVVNLIGERPGLTSASSMSAYITFNPGPHTISSDRTVVSNIHAGGTPAIEAGAYITRLIKTILQAQCSGVKLQQLR